MTCEQVLLKYITDNEGWHKKVHLYVIAEDWSPESTGRALRKLKEKDQIDVGYYDGKYSKNLAKYRLAGKKQYRTLTTESGRIIKIEI